jgi:hypothetical protein
LACPKSQHTTCSILCVFINMHFILYHSSPHEIRPPVKFLTLLSELSVFPNEPQIKHSSKSYPLVPLVNFIQNPQASDKPCSLVNLIQELPSKVFFKIPQRISS